MTKTIPKKKKCKKAKWWSDQAFQIADKESACSVGDLGLIPGVGRSLGEGKGYPLHYSGLENSIDYSPWGLKESDMTERLLLSSLTQSQKTK